MKSSSGGEVDFSSTLAWLKKNDLESLKTAFEQRQINVEELMEFAPDDLREFANELRLDDTTSAKFVESVLNTKNPPKVVKQEGESNISAFSTSGEGSSTSTSTSTSTGSMTPLGSLSISRKSSSRIIITPAEDQAMAKLHEKHAALQRASQTLAKSTDILEENNKKCIVSIEKVIGECIAELQARKLSLINTVNMIKATKKKTYENQMKKYQLQHQSILQVKEGCEERLSNPNIDSTSRSLLIGREIRALLAKDMELELPTQPDIKMVCNGHMFTEFLDSFLVHGCDVPPPPKLKTGDITFESIEVQWKDEAEKALVDNYELCYASAKSKGKNKSKKSSKKSKRKKNDSDDSESSNSESESESESDSRSETESVDEKADGLTGNFDPEKYKWKVKKIKNGKDGRSYVIKKLNCETKYLIRIRAQNGSGWGPYSDVLPVSTKQLKLYWNKKLHGSEIVFPSKHRAKFPAKQSRAAANYSIKLKEHDKFSFEFTLHTVSNYSWIGFTKSPVSKFTTNWEVYMGSSNDYGLGVGLGTTTISIYQLGVSRSVTTTTAVQNGDKFRFVINGKKQSCEVYHNKNNLGIIFTGIYEEVCPAASGNSSISDVSIRYKPRK